MPTVTNLPSARQAIHGLHQNDAVAAIQVLRRAGIITSDQCPDALLSVLRAKLVPWTHVDTAMYVLGITKAQLARARDRAARGPQLVDYQGAAASTRYNEARGYCRGLARAIELLEVRVDA